jgi:hypothetical protein
MARGRGRWAATAASFIQEKLGSFCKRSCVLALMAGGNRPRHVDQGCEVSLGISQSQEGVARARHAHPARINAASQPPLPPTTFKISGAIALRRQYPACVRPLVGSGVGGATTSAA